MGPEGKMAMPVLVELLKDKDANVRLAAIDTLRQVSPDPATAISVLVELLRDQSTIVRIEAAKTLGHMGPEAVSAVPALVELVRDRATSFRAAGVIRNAGPEMKAAAQPKLMELLRHGDSAVRLNAAWALTNTDRAPSRPYRRSGTPQDATTHPPFRHPVVGEGHGQGGSPRPGGKAHDKDPNVRMSAAASQRSGRILRRQCLPWPSCCATPAAALAAACFEDIKA
jgi:hypothetical protein